MVIGPISYQKLNYGLKEKLSHPFLIPFHLEQNCFFGYKDGIWSKINIDIKNNINNSKTCCPFEHNVISGWDFSLSHFCQSESVYFLVVSFAN